MNVKKSTSLTIFFTMLISLSAQAGGTLYTIQTNSFDCDFCVYDLEQKFMKMKGVKEFDTDVDGLLFIKIDGTLKLEQSLVKKLLIKNGFDFKGMTEKKQ